MIRSMTGVGRAEVVLADKNKIIVEIRSTNHRYFELNMKLPDVLLHYESQIRKIVNKRILRGSIQLAVNIISDSDSFQKLLIPQLTNKSEQFLSNFKLNYGLLMNLLIISKELKEKFNLSGELDINTILSFPNIILPVQGTESNNKKIKWLSIKEIINKAIDNLNMMKQTEGEFLYKDFIYRIKIICQKLENIKKRSQKIQAQVQTKTMALSNKSEQIELLNGQRIITEEIVRLSSHIKTFIRTLKYQGTQSIGRKLEFILAEMLRESETILAKAKDILIIRNGIAIKQEIDVLREQARNIE
ncbi:MAG: DUF1732 domain-containing protein [candidate division WOR-3 bacterium]